MKKIIIYGITKELDQYSPEFMNKVDYIVTDDIEKMQIYKEKKVKNYDWLLNQKEVFIIISNISNKLKAIKKLSGDGFVKNRDFVWGPEWLGSKTLSSCYPIKSWKENEAKYDFSKLEGPWDYRYRELLSLISQDSFKSVMDCGAGNMSLKRMLDDNILYYPVDQIKKYPETIVCDFNRKEFPNIFVDITFLCGILEYITCPEVFLNKVCEHSQTVLMTYCSLHTHPDISSRMMNGWVNHFTTGELVKLFIKEQFCLTDELYEEKGGVFLRFDKQREKNG